MKVKDIMTQSVVCRSAKTNVGAAVYGDWLRVKSSSFPCSELTSWSFSSLTSTRPVSALVYRRAIPCGA